ncbi:MAG: glycosyltransferase [Candidatus Omnitrophota bacterium]|jgi:hypothetical protein
MSADKLIIVGSPEINHISGYFRNAALELGVLAGFSDIRHALSKKWLLNKIYWHCLDHRPVRLDQFGREVFDLCKRVKPNGLLCTGFAPLSANILKKIGESNIVRINYLTDDPWNPVHQALWFMRGLPLYDHVFSVRRANIPNLELLDGPKIHYLPFGYAPETHYLEKPATEEEEKIYDCDVVFVGGADRDRLPYIRAIIKEAMILHLYGGYWNRFKDTKRYWKGHANPGQVRKAVSGAKINLCLVRRANRDGNSMRSFEAPAMGGCMLLEETEEHRAIFGEDGRNVAYFSSISEMIDKIKWLLGHYETRKRISQNAHNLIIQGKHTYKDRLVTILEHVRLANGTNPNVLK